MKSLPAQCLPDPLPSNPLIIAEQWLAEARSDDDVPNPNAMVLASVDSAGQPSARVVLCKSILPESGAITFFTNFQSRKGQEFAANPRAAAVFHWDHRHRQVRIEGSVQPLENAESEAYFRTRHWFSRLGAWASQQSAPLPRGQTLAQLVTEAARRLGLPYGGPGTPEPATIDVDIPKPPHWGGYCLQAHAVELWVEGAFRLHDRARWTCDVAGPKPRAWSGLRLQP
jgi:pyridoxamine 5'-phosphate oxidase